MSLKIWDNQYWNFIIITCEIYSNRCVTVTQNMIILKYLMAKMINQHKLKNLLEAWEVLVFQALEICYLSNSNQMIMILEDLMDLEARRRRASATSSNFGAEMDRRVEAGTTTPPPGLTRWSSSSSSSSSSLGQSQPSAGKT